MLLALYLLAIAYALFSAYLSFSGFIESYPYLLGLDSGIAFLCGPFIYFYVKSLIEPRFELQKSHFVHLSPFVLQYLFMYVFLWGKGVGFRDAVLAGEAVVDPTARLISNFFKIAVSLVYYWFAYKMLNSSKDGRLGKTGVLLPVKVMLALTTLISGVILIALITSIITENAPYAMSFVSIVYLLLFLFIYAVLFFSLKIPVFVQNTESADTKEKYAGSNFSHETLQEVWNRAVELLETEKCYNRSTFNAKDAANALGVNNKVLSQAINVYGEHNFSAFVNDFRIKEFKSRIAAGDSEKLTIWAIAEECGFSSKSSFHSVFKRHEGMTPKEFINQLVQIQDSGL